MIDSKYRRGDVMKYYSRPKETLKSCMYILIGLIGLYFVSAKLQALNIEDKTIAASKEVEEQARTKHEMEIHLNIDKLYKYSKEPISEESVMELIKNHVPGGIYLMKASMNQNHDMHNMILTYLVEEDVPMMNKAKKDQITLLDASILMSLYPDLDAVKVNIIVESDTYSEVLYRPDLEDYFGIHIAAQDEKNTFERIVNEFIDSSKVSQYCNMKHPYDSFMGEEVEAFYKMNFPVVEEGEVFPYIDEALEGELVETYGYKLFLQGLIYENPLMNYYSAYRLIEYYGSNNSEEIMLELATCMTKTQDERVQKACQKNIDLLVPLKEGIKVFDRFNESSIEGGKKLYTITEKGLQTLAKWQGENSAGLKVVSISPNQEYVLCEAKTANNSYRYILSCNTEEAYLLDESGAFKNGSKNINELIAQIKSVTAESINQAIQADEIEWEWYGKDLMRMHIGEEIALIYNIHTDEVQTKAEYIQDIGLNELEQYLQETYQEVTKTPVSNLDAKATVKKFVVDGEVLMVYEYESILQKNMAISSDEGQARQLSSRMWQQGKLVIYYDGNDIEIIRGLNQFIL